MKLILCSVFLAHGAVVYGVCTGPSLLLPWTNRGALSYATFDINSICTEGSAEKKAYHPPVVPTCHPREGGDPHSAGTFLDSCPRSSRGQALRGNDKFGAKSNTNLVGWKVIGDIHIDTPQTFTLRMTVNKDGKVIDWSVDIFLSPTLRQELHAQIHNFSFVWEGSTPIPENTIFEKKIIYT